MTTRIVRVVGPTWLTAADLRRLADEIADDVAARRAWDHVRGGDAAAGRAAGAFPPEADEWWEADDRRRAAQATGRLREIAELLDRTPGGLPDPVNVGGMVAVVGQLGHREHVAVAMILGTWEIALNNEPEEGQ